MACYWIIEMGPRGGTRTCRYGAPKQQQTCNISCCILPDGLFFWSVTLFEETANIIIDALNGNSTERECS